MLQGPNHRSVARVGISVFAMFLAASVAAAAQAGPPVDSRWAVRTIDRGPNGIKETRCGPLDYFLGNPKDFEYDSGLLVPKMIKDDVTQHRLGVISGFVIYDVIHRIESDSGPNFIKMILVERRPGELCEIFNEQGPLGFGGVSELRPAFSVLVGSQRVLGTSDPVDGNCGCSQEAYWTFDKDGPIFLDMSVIDDALERAAQELKLTYPGWELWHGSDFDVRALTYTRGVRGLNPGGEGTGVIRLKFALKDHQLVFVSQQFY